jgi:hypothetical protein
VSAAGAVGALGAALIDGAVTGGCVAITGAAVGRGPGVNVFCPPPSVVLSLLVVVWALITTEGLLSPPRVVLVALPPLLAEVSPPVPPWLPAGVVDEAVEDAGDTGEPDDVFTVPVPMPVLVLESVLVSPPPAVDPPSGPAHATPGEPATAAPMPSATASAPTRPMHMA